MTPIVTPRHIFGEAALARLQCDEPIAATDAGTGITLHYRFEHAAGGKLRLTGGVLGDTIIAVGCDADDLNLIATILLAGFAPRAA